MPLYKTMKKATFSDSEEEDDDDDDEEEDDDDEDTNTPGTSTRNHRVTYLRNTAH